MNIIPVSPEENPEELPYPIATAIGNFDGLHLGHRFLIEKMKQIAESINALPAVCTFSPLPARFFGGDTPLITTLPQRLSLMEQLGVKICIILDFNAFASVSPTSFFNILLNRFMVKAITVGADFRFGKDREGDTKMLAKLCKESGVNLTSLDKRSVKGISISSSYIRNLALQGEVECIPEYLGRPLSIIGSVKEGDKLGHTIGFPTANLSTDNELIPPPGVYGGMAKLLREEYKALIYIGIRPTLHGKELRIEANLQNFPNHNIYGEKVELEFNRRIRGEMKFADLQELKGQIIKDRELL
ncbi:MAG: riboflavin biosynthesis protein RibF [Deferribacteraceae bacterium]|jgi:riboflavin kinase/FMN adenylyltransferase|nr:riboflavin biosynthesis protein RibF [Deferribacteraceae bacterium]